MTEREKLIWEAIAESIIDDIKAGELFDDLNIVIKDSVKDFIPEQEKNLTAGIEFVTDIVKNTGHNLFN